MFLKKIDDWSFITKKVGLQNFVKFSEDFDFFVIRFDSLRKRIFLSLEQCTGKKARIFS